jgi:AcrR family transcriptional regulator
MPYRRTETVIRRLAAREQTILAAALALAAEGGLQAVHIAAVAGRAQIAAGTMYRYFPAKTDLVAAVVATVTARELEAVRAAADAAPGPLSALAAGIGTFAARCLGERRLMWALLGEEVDAELGPLRLEFQRALAGELDVRIRAATVRKLLPEQNASLSAPAVIGAVAQSLLGPLAAAHADPAAARTAVQDATLFALRALGIVDARARGLVAQTPLPAASF